MSELDRGMKAGIVFFGHMDALVSKGYMNGPLQLTPKGTALFDQIIAEGFRLTNDELNGLIKCKLPSMDAKDQEAMVVLIRDSEANP